MKSTRQKLDTQVETKIDNNKNEIEIVSTDDIEMLNMNCIATAIQTILSE